MTKTKIVEVVSNLFSHDHKPKHKNGSHNVVYGSITLKFFVGSGNYSTPVVKLHKKSKKKIILGHPTVNGLDREEEQN